MRKYSLCTALLALLFSLVGCSKSENKTSYLDFETLMGRDYPCWKHVQTAEDYENINFFKTIYEKNIPFLDVKSTMLHIPKVIHFIWLGPKPFPRKSVENIRSWIAKHPGWTFKFWTDRDRSPPHKQMQLARIQDLPFIKLFNCYKKSDNYAEKSDLVRYEILYQQGGVYVDHDVKCLKSFEPLCRTYDFFCGMEMPYQTFLSSSVLPTSNVLGCRQGHPILKNAMDWLDQLWDRIELQFPGKDRDAVINRVAHRTMLGLAEAFKMKSNEVGNRDIALPTFYFNAPEEKVAIFSYHLRKETWLESESEFEHLVKERLGKISKKTNRVLFVFGIFSVLNIIGLLLLIMKYGKKSRSTI